MPRVLLIDNDPETAPAIEGWLSSEGVCVDWTPPAQAAVAMSRGHVDLVLVAATCAEDERDVARAAAQVPMVRMDGGERAVRALVPPFLRQAERVRELEAAQRAQRELTACIVHDFRNPLSVISGNVSWLAQEVANPPAGVRDALRDLVRAADSLRRLADDLLAVHAADGGELPARPRPCAVLPLVEEVVHALHADAAAKAITVEVDVPPELEGAIDRDLICRALTHLLEAAIRQAPQGSRSRVDARLRAAGGLDLRVLAHGVPVDPGQSAGLFDKFARVRETSGGARWNVGLGLHFCRRVAEAHGGTVALHDISDWPVAFVVALP